MIMCWLYGCVGSPGRLKDLAARMPLPQFPLAVGERSGAVDCKSEVQHVLFSVCSLAKACTEAASLSAQSQCRQPPVYPWFLHQVFKCFKSSTSSAVLASPLALDRRDQVSRKCHTCMDMA